MIVKGGFVHVAFALIKRITIDTNLTTEPCYRHCAAAFFLSSIYISQAFKITARCKDLLSDVMTSCLFCIICLLNILKRTEYYSKFASKTLT